jgi:mercuric ion transport protein
MYSTMNKTPVVIGSSLSAMGSSLVATVTAFCCVGPAVIAVLGTSGALAAARLAPYRPYFIAGSLLLLGLGFWLAYRPQGGCIQNTCTTRPAKTTRALLWLAALVTAVAILVPNLVRG